MKSLAITLLLVIFLVPMTAYAQNALNNISIQAPEGSTNILLTVEGPIQDDGELVLKVRGYFGSDSQPKMYQESYIITEDNRSHVFELDYPFMPNEVYHITAKNGPSGFAYVWIPYLVTQEASTNTGEVIVTNFEQAQSTSVILGAGEGLAFESARDENNLLSQEAQKKDAVLMEQVKVIQDLASQISNVMYTNSLESVSLTLAQVEPTTPRETFYGYLNFLGEENIHLSEEIAKKDAVLMEQLKVIQELASKVKNANFDEL